MFAKSKPVSLVSNEMNVNQSAMLDSGISCSPENDRMTSWNSDLPRIEKSRRDVNQRSSIEKSMTKGQKRQGDKVDPSQF